MKKGQGLSTETIIIAILVLIVLVVLILIFTGKLGQWRVQTEEVGALERFAGGDVDVGGSCSLEGQFGGGTCRATCQEGEGRAVQSSKAERSSLCKFGLACCKSK